tara:strand:- start:556 stop:786 length:231 start_codon:yes stop_codon:yes gene_type:complete
LQKEQIQIESTFDYCSKNVKTFKQSLNCQQDKLHGTLTENPLGFIVFYVFAILFVAFLFQLSTKNMNKKGKKNKRP